MIRFDRLLSALFIIIIVMINLSNAAEKSETVRLGCADDLNQTALDVVKKAVKDYWVKEKAWDAAKSLEEALILEPRLYLGYDILKIHYCFHQKKCDQAVTLLRKAVKYCPNYYGHNYGLAEVYVKMGSLPKALENYAIALEKGQPETAYFYYKIAESQFSIRDMEQAIYYLRKSIDLDEL